MADFAYLAFKILSTNQWITLITLPEGDDQFHVEQYMVETSKTSDSGRSLDQAAIHVDPLPVDASGQLPPHVVVAPVYACSSVIGIPGLVPGAYVSVEIVDGPSLVPEQARHGVTDTFDLGRSDPLLEVAMLNGWQSIVSGISIDV